MIDNHSFKELVKGLNIDQLLLLENGEKARYKSEDLDFIRIRTFVSLLGAIFADNKFDFRRTFAIYESLFPEDHYKTCCSEDVYKATTYYKHIQFLKRNKYVYSGYT
jgi:hypothetical protein